MWRRVKLGEICEISIGKTPPRGDKRFWDKEKKTDNVWLSIADLTAVSGKFVSDSKEYVSDEGAKLFKPVPQNTLVMSFKLSIGKLAITERELRTNEAIAALPIKNESLVSKEFLYHYLSSLDWGVIAGNDEKVKGKTLNKKKLNALEVILPPLAEQQRIVAKLDAAFAKIDRAVESSRCALRHADVLLVKVIETATSSAEHSQIVKVADVSDMQSGYGFKSGDYSDDATDVPLLRGDNIAPNYIDLSSAKRLPVKLAADYKRFELQTEDVILAMDRPYISTGLRLAKINESHMPCLLVQRVMRLRAEPKLNPDFLYLAMETPRFLDHILGNQTGLGVPHISGKTIGSFEFEMPSLEQQARIVSDVSAAKEQIKFLRLSHERRIDELINLRSALLTQELQPPHSEAA